MASAQSARRGDGRRSLHRCTAGSHERRVAILAHRCVFVSLTVPKAKPKPRDGRNVGESRNSVRWHRSPVAMDQQREGEADGAEGPRRAEGDGRAGARAQARRRRAPPAAEGAGVAMGAAAAPPRPRATPPSPRGLHVRGPHVAGRDLAAGRLLRGSRQRPSQITLD